MRNLLLLISLAMLLTSCKREGVSKNDQKIIVAACQYGVLYTEHTYTKRDGRDELGPTFAEDSCNGLLKRLDETVGLEK